MPHKKYCALNQPENIELGKECDCSSNPLQNTSFNISKEANKELNTYKAEQELSNKSEAVLVAISKARKFDEIKYKSNEN